MVPGGYIPVADHICKPRFAFFENNVSSCSISTTPLPPLGGAPRLACILCPSLVTLLLLHSNSHLSLSQLYFAVLFQKLFFYQHCQKVNIIFWSSLQQIDTNLKAPISCKRSNRTNIPKSNNWTIASLVVQGCLFVQTEIIFVTSITSSACVKLLSLG